MSSLPNIDIETLPILKLIETLLYAIIGYNFF